MNDHAYLYANTPDKSIMYDLAVQRALGESAGDPGWPSQTEQQLPPPLPAPPTRLRFSQGFEKWTASS